MRYNEVSTSARYLSAWDSHDRRTEDEGTLPRIPAIPLAKWVLWGTIPLTGLYHYSRNAPVFTSRV